MIPNSLIRASQSILTHMGEASGNGASAASAAALRAAAGPSVPPSAASVAFTRAAAGGSAAGMVAIPSIPLHAIGTPAAAPNANVEAPEAPFVAIPDNDSMSIIAGYLTQDDQLKVRTLSNDLKGVVDSEVEALSLTPGKALDLFSDGSRFRNLKTLALTDWVPADLLAFANALRVAGQSPFELVLGRRTGHDYSDDGDTLGLEHAAAINLSSLSLRSFTVTSGACNALSNVAFPVDMEMVGRCHEAGDFPATQIATLRSLDIGTFALPDDVFPAFQAHPGLIAFSSQGTHPDQIKHFLDNPRMQSLDVWRISSFDEGNEFETIANHPSLISLGEVLISKPEQVAMLSQNAKIAKLRVQFQQECKDTSPLTEMLSLRDLTIVTRQTYGRFDYELKASHIEAICRKPLDRLSFAEAELDYMAKAIAVTAHATELSFGKLHGKFDRFITNRLLANPHVSRLSLDGNVDDGGAARLAASPTISHFDFTFDTNRIADTLKVVRGAWEKAGKPLSDLTCEHRSYRPYLL